jgi:hypothetical protein
MFEFDSGDAALNGPIRNFFEAWFTFHPNLGLHPFMDALASIYNFFYGIFGLSNLFAGF